MAEPPTFPVSVYGQVPLPLGTTTCIRVIKLRPSSTSNFLDDIACDFSILDVRKGALVGDGDASQESIDLANAGSGKQHTKPRKPRRIRYEALSYAWGDTPADRLIQLNGTPFNVRQNLWDFLDQARRSTLDTYLWIDAICIDQTTVGERNHQVAMMGDIYSKADRVIVWLGDCDEKTRFQLSAFIDVKYYYSRYGKFRTRFPVERVVKKSASKQRKDEAYRSGQRISGIQRDGLGHEFCSLPYWSRVWIVQEYHLAKAIVIWYGSLRSDHQKLQDFVRLAKAHKPPGSPAHPASSVVEGRNQRLNRPWQSKKTKQEFETFLALLIRFGSGMDCHDRRDRIYALLALLDPAERRELDIHPDYSRTAEELFISIISRLKAQPDTPHVRRAMNCLRLMLLPNLQDASLQINILDMRASGTPWLPNRVFEALDHECPDSVDSYLAIGVGGCTLCGERPALPLTRHSLLLLFSRRDWREYLVALLASQKEVDRKLGIKLLKDRELRLALHEGDSGPPVKAMLNNQIQYRNHGLEQMWTSCIH